MSGFWVWFWRHTLGKKLPLAARKRINTFKHEPPSLAILYFTSCAQSNYKLCEMGCPGSVIYQLTHHHNTHFLAHSLGAEALESERRKMAMSDGVMLELKRSNVSSSPFQKAQGWRYLGGGPLKPPWVTVPSMRVCARFMHVCVRDCLF